MKSPKFDHFLSAVCLKGNYILLFKNKNISPSPYYLPGCRVSSFSAPSVRLINALNKKYSIKASAKTPLPISHDEKTLVHPYLCKIRSDSMKLDEGIEAAYINLNEIDRYYIDSLDREIVKRVLLFLPLLNGNFVNFERDEKEKKLVDTFLKVIKYFEDRIGEEEARFFVSLTKTDADIDNLTAALNFVLSIHRCDFNEALDSFKAK